MDEFNEAQPTSVPKTKKRKSVTPKSMTRRMVLSFPHAPWTALLLRMHNNLRPS
jgi:hypothetical protein